MTLAVTRLNQSRSAPHAQGHQVDSRRAGGRRPGRRSSPSMRWVLVHMIEETGRHAGHADILRELIDGSTGR